MMDEKGRRNVERYVKTIKFRRNGNKSKEDKRIWQKLASRTTVRKMKPNEERKRGGENVGNPN